MVKDTDLTEPRVCSHCGDTTVFKRQDTYYHRYDEEDLEWWVKYVWQVLECLSCSKLTLWQGRIDSDEVSLINFIVEEMITRPREIGEIYTTLPQSQLDQIRRRDGAS